MKLQDFIQGSLVQIIKGVEGATQELGDTTAMVSPRYIPDPEGRVIGFAFDETESEQHRKRRLVEIVEFDVAVVAAEGTETKGGIGIVVGSIGIGSQGKSESSSTSHSRLKFRVPIVLPSQSA